MTTLYKLTTQEGTTYGGTLWGPGITHSASGPKGGALCSSSYIHAYRDPLLAVLLNPIHADFRNPVLWECEGEVITDDRLKVGCSQLTTVKVIPLPEVTTTQRVRFAILCAMKVFDDPEWGAWASGWLSGKRDKAAVQAARATAQARMEMEMEAAGAANSAAGAANSAAWATAQAAWVAEGAAWAAARAAMEAAWALGAAARAAAEAARAANWAAEEAAKEIDLRAIAREAIEAGQ